MHGKTVPLLVVAVLLVASTGIAAVGAAVASGGDLGQNDGDGATAADGDVATSDVGEILGNLVDRIATMLHDIRDSLTSDGTMESAVHKLADLGSWIRGAT